MGRGPQVRPKWLVSAGRKDISQTWRRGALRHVASGGAKGRAGSGVGGLVPSQGGPSWAYRGGCDRRARTWGADRR